VTVVGVGASAGGLEALERLFRAMPTATGAAFVVVQHLSRDHDSVMDRLLSRTTSMTVTKAEDGMALQPNQIYVIPPAKELIISGGRLLLTETSEKLGLEQRRPIDIFFRSLAQECGDRAVAVVLSGTGSDGARGIAEVHEVGGLVLCQSLDSAKFDGMPRSAIDTGLVELAARPAELPQAIETFFKLSDLDRSETQQSLIERILVLMNEDHDVDFSHYKRNMVERRIQRRIALRSVDSETGYAQLIEHSPDERDELYRDLLIGVTRFYRDPAAFDELADKVLPDLVERMAGGEELRVWVCGCGTGEEAYTVAMLIHEAFRQQEAPVRARIFATDLHQRSLDHAARGLYSEASVEELPEELRGRYFTQVSDGYQVNDELRKIVVFAKHDAVADAPFTRLHLITCRNLLIYLQAAAQRKVLSLFLFGLQSRGVLMLGRSETASAFSDELRTVADRARIYRKHGQARLTSGLGRRFIAPTAVKPSSPEASGPDTWSPRRLIRAYDQLLERYMPPGILVDDQLQLVHVFGDASRFLHLSSGRPSRDLSKLLREELRGPVLGILQRARGRDESVSLKRLQGPDGEMLGLEAQRLPTSSARDFTVVRIETLDLPPAAPKNKVEIEADTLNDERIASLEEELLHTRESLQATIEELESGNEEMQATNEELVASNEELQSTNEELQSVNEELYTVNAELERKLDELSQMTADMEHLLASIEVGTIYVDANRRVRRFTPMAAEKFHFEVQDLGRDIGDFNIRIELPSLMEDLDLVLKEERRIEREVKDDGDRWYLLRMLPYHRKENVAGAVITFIDVDALKDAQQEAQEEVLRRDEFLAMLSHELRNPLAAILNAAQLADLRPDKLVDALGLVRRQSSHMAGLLRDLLDVSRVATDKLVIDRKPCDFRVVIEGAVEATESRAENREVELEVTTPDESLPLFGDPVRLRQMVTNLLHNAIKYNGPGGHVWFKVYRWQGSLVLRVKDDGIGMEEEAIEELFEPFVQSRRGASKAEGGMGLGLSLVKAIAEQHGGSVRAHSSGIGEGSEFVVRLPLDEALDIGEHGDLDNPASASTRHRILMVEDDPDSRETMKLLFEHLGYEVRAVATAKEALEAFAEQKPSVVITDVGLPDMNGLELVRQLRERAGDSLVILTVSGYGRPSDKKAADAAGVDEHLVKPVTLETLEESLSSHLAAGRSGKSVL